MSGRNIEDYFQDTEAFDALSDEDRARLFSGESIQGETDASKAEENSDSPDAVTVDPEATKPPVVNEPEPVVLAKDGQHTIPFAELEAARERTRQLEQEVIALKSKPATQQPEENNAPEGEPGQSESNEDKLLRLRREEREAMYSTDTELAEKLGKEADALNRHIAKEEMRSENAAQEAERKAQESQDNAVTDALARANALVEKYPFLNPGTAATNQDAIDLVVAQRDKLMSQGVAFGDAIEQAVAKVAPLFGKGTTQQTETDVARKAAEVISKAKAPVATSLSQAPAGTKPQHDEGEAMRNMDINRLAQSLESKSPEEIMRIMAKAL